MKKEEDAGGTPALSEEEVHAKIEEYNTQVSNHGMNLVSFITTLYLSNEGRDLPFYTCCSSLLNGQK